MEGEFRERNGERERTGRAGLDLNLNHVVELLEDVHELALGHVAKASDPEDVGGDLMGGRHRWEDGRENGH